MTRDPAYSVLSPDAAGIRTSELGLNQPEAEEDPNSVQIRLRQTDDHTDVVLSRGMCPTGGYEIGVCAVEFGSAEDRSQVIITVHLRDPGPNDLVTMMTTRPTAVVRFTRDLFAVRRVTVKSDEGDVLDSVRIHS
jgi:hypothetical protein